LLQGLLPFSRGHAAPLIHELLDFHCIHSSLAALSDDATFGCRAGRVITTRRTVAVAAVRAAVAVGSGPAWLAVLFGFVLQLANELIEPGDDFLLNLLRLRTAPGQVEPPLDVFHFAGDRRQVLFLPRLHVQ